MSTFSEVGAAVAAKVTEISRLLQDAGIAEPTFNEDGINAFDAEQLAKNETLRQARNTLIDASRDLYHLAMGPSDHLISLSWSAASSANLGTVIRLKIPQAIPRHDFRSLQELAFELNLPEHIVLSTMRYAISNGIFCEPLDGVFGHTATSARLAIDTDIQDYSSMCSAEISSLLTKWPDMVASKRDLGADGAASASNLAFPQYENVFQYFGQNPEAAQRYRAFLDARARIPRWSAEYLVDAWDWKSIGNGTVVDVGAPTSLFCRAACCAPISDVICATAQDVDHVVDALQVGGSTGSTSLLLAKNFPSIQLVSQDISDEALKEGQALVESLKLSDRIAFSHHDFFTPQQVKAKVYLLKNILHDWPDEDCAKIIHGLLPALEDGAHVLISEGILPDEPERRTSTFDDHAMRVEQQLMIAAHGASERTLGQYQAMFHKVSDKFEYNGVWRGSNGAFFSLIDFVYQA